MGLAGPSAGQSLADWVLEKGIPSSLGSGFATQPSEMDLTRANVGNNLLRGGGMESWSAGTSAAPDGWGNGGVAGITYAKNTTDVQGGDAACDVTNGAAAAGALAQTVIGTIGANDWTWLRGHDVTFSAWVKCSTAERVRLYIIEDAGTGVAYSSYHTGSGTYELLSVTKRLTTSAVLLSVFVSISSGGAMTITVDNAMLVLGNTPIEFQPHPNDEQMRISNYQSVTPTDFVDQGVWRTEIGQIAIAGNIAVNEVTKTLTFQTAFRTIRCVLVTSGGGDGATGVDQGFVGGKMCLWATYNVAITGCTVIAKSVDGANFGGTANGEAVWVAIGQV